MTEKDVAQLFEDVGVILHGHFKLTSGKHSPTFLQCAQLMKHPDKTESIAKELAAPFADDKVDLVIGPAMGGIILSYEVARQLGCQAMFVEKDEAGMRLRRGFKITPNSRVLVVEDAVTTGGSVQKTLDALAAIDVEVVGVGVLVDRSAGKVKLHPRQYAMLTLDIPSYDPENCPLCATGQTLTSPKDLGM